MPEAESSESGGKRPSLMDTIKASAAQVRSRFSKGEEAPEREEREVEETEKPTRESKPPRKEKPETDESSESEDAPEAPADLEDHEAKPAEEEAKPAFEAPSDWSDEDKERFKTFSPEMQERIAKRWSVDESALNQERERAKYIQEYYAPIEHEVQSRLKADPHFADTPPLEAIQGLFNAHDRARTSPANFAIEVLLNNEVDPVAFAKHILSNPQSFRPAAPAVDPRIATLERQVQTFTQSQQKAETGRFMAELKAAGEAKDASGKDAYPHRDVVAKPLADWFTYLKRTEPYLPTRELFQKAYTRAVAETPEVQSRIEAESRAQSEKKRIADAKAKAAAAKKAGSSLTGSPTSNGGPGIPKDIGGQLRYHAARLRGNARA